MSAEERFPMAVGPLMEQLLTLSDLLFELFHAASMLFKLLAISPAVGRMLLWSSCFQIVLNQTGPGSALLRPGRTAVWPCRGVWAMCATARASPPLCLVTMAEFPRTGEIRRRHTIHLKTTELGMNAHHCLTGQHHPNVFDRSDREEEGTVPAHPHLSTTTAGVTRPLQLG